MVKEKKMASIVIVSLLFVLLCACTKQLDFDAKSYVQSFLDAEYHGNYADYANLMEIKCVKIVFIRLKTRLHKYLAIK